MIESILIALGVLGSGGIYYFMNKRVNSLEGKVSKAESEAITAKGYQQNAQENVEKLKEKHQNFIKNIKVQMNQKLVELEEKYKKQADDRVQKVIADYQEALKIETQGLENQVAELDEKLGQKIQQITGKNLMFFTCACDRTKQIPCSVDLSSDQNYFTCPDCGAVYRIVISASTVLMSGISNNVKIANMYDGVDVADVERTTL